jgi:hypothetical protein
MPSYKSKITEKKTLYTTIQLCTFRTENELFMMERICYPG